MNYKFEYFSNTKPNIINPNIQSNFEDILKTTSKSYDTVDYLGSFYEDFIKPNLFVLIMLLLIGLFLLYKYLDKQERNDNKKEYEDYKNIGEVDKLLNINKEKLESNLEKLSSEKNQNILIPELYKESDYKSFRPTFNPSLPIDRQQSFTNYLPDNIAVKYNNEFINNNQLNPPKVVRKEYIPFLHNPENRESILGLNNSYENSKDSSIINSLGYPMDYNRTTSNAIEFATELNRNNIDIMDKYNNNVNNSLLNYKNNKYEIDMPFI